MGRDELLGLLREHRATLAQRFGVAELSLFDSFARDQATGDSDIDLLVQIDGPTTSKKFFWHAVRDLKSHRFGFALRYARTKRAERLETLLLVAALASFILWLLGLAASDRQWTRHFQANTERRRCVLSTVFFGHELWRSHRFTVTLADLCDPLNRLKLLVAHEAQYA